MSGPYLAVIAMLLVATVDEVPKHDAPQEAWTWAVGWQQFDERGRKIAVLPIDDRVQAISRRESFPIGDLVGMTDFEPVSEYYLATTDLPWLVSGLGDNRVVDWECRFPFGRNGKWHPMRPTIVDGMPMHLVTGSLYYRENGGQPWAADFEIRVVLLSPPDGKPDEANFQDHTAAIRWATPRMIDVAAWDRAPSPIMGDK